MAFKKLQSFRMYFIRTLTYLLTLFRLGLGLDTDRTISIIATYFLDADGCRP
jgi:hypothetical protein